MSTLDARFVRLQQPVQITLHIPGRYASAQRRAVTGRLVGEMHMRGALHHLRVAGDDGVLYFAPPSGLPRRAALRPPTPALPPGWLIRAQGKHRWTH